MRSKIWIGLAFLGGFLLVLGVLGQTYAATKLLKTPINVDSVTRLTGTASLNGPDGVEDFPVKVTSTTRSDTSKSDGSVIVFKSSSCVVRDEGDVPDCVSNDDPDKRLLTASTDDFAVNRKTALAVNETKYLPSSAVPHKGTVNKFPFNAKKKTYPYWSGTVGDSVDAVYDRTQKLDGLETYVYKVDIKDAPIEVADGVKGLYNDAIELYIDPYTGAIIDQSSNQSRTLTNGDPVLALDVKFTDAQVKANVDDAKSNTSKLKLVTKTLPLVGYIIGIPALLIGIVMLVVDGRREEESDTESGVSLAKR